MTFKQRNITINTNLNGDCYENLMAGRWQVGLFSDNPNLKNKNNEEYYKTITVADMNKDTHRCLKNKVTVKLLDGSIVQKHIIHWIESENYFCIDNDIFWDQFD